MKLQASVTLLTSLVAVVSASGVTEQIAPKGQAPTGCKSSYGGTFEITINAANGKRSIEKRECTAEGALVLSLNNGILTDSKSRTGYIASNYQWQFDGPPQAGAIYTAGWSVCENGQVALGDSKTFYRCLSGKFYNLYNKHWAAQCEAVSVFVVPCGNAARAQPSQIADGQVQTPTGGASGAGGSSSSNSGAQPAGKPAGSSGSGSGSGSVSQIGDGQIQAPSGSVAPAPSAPAGGKPVSQIGDGQIQVPSGSVAPAPSAPAGKPVSQIGDGQIQAPSGSVAPAPSAPAGKPVSQIGDGQIQAPSGSVAPAPSAPAGKPVSQIGDGQIQAPSGSVGPAPSAPVVSQIGDGQIQAPASSAPPASPTAPTVSQIGDGQIQAPGSSTTPTPVASQIGDGQIQAPSDVPQKLDANSAAKTLPGTLAALFIAIMGFAFYL